MQADLHNAEALRLFAVPERLQRFGILEVSLDGGESWEQIDFE